MTDEQIKKIIDALPVRPTDKVLLRFAREIERAVLAEKVGTVRVPMKPERRKCPNVGEHGCTLHNLQCAFPACEQ